MALRISRRSTDCGRPPGLGLGIRGWTSFHWASVRSVGYFARLIPFSTPKTRGEVHFSHRLLEFGMAVDRRLVVIDLGHGVGRSLFGAFVLVPRTPYQGDPAGARQFKDLVGSHGFDEGLDLLLLARDLDHELLGTDVNDPAPEDLHQRLDFRPLGGGDLELDEHQVALNVVFTRDVVDLDNRDQFLELLAHLLEMTVVALHDHGNSREPGCLGLAHGKTVDVETPRGEHARDLRQDTWLVLHERREDMADPAGVVGFPGRWGGRTETLTRWSRHRRSLMPPWPRGLR